MNKKKEVLFHTAPRCVVQLIVVGGIVEEKELERLNLVVLVNGKST